MVYYCQDWESIDAALDAGESFDARDVAREVVRQTASDKRLNGKPLPVK